MLYPRTTPTPPWIASATNRDAGAGGDAGGESDAGGGGGGDASGGDAGDAGDDDAGGGKVSLSAIEGLLTKALSGVTKSVDQRFKKINDELAGRRHAGRHGDREAPAKRSTDSGNEREGDREDAGEDTRDLVTRKELRAERDFDREMMRLEDDERLDSEDLDWVTEGAERLPVEARAQFVSAYRRGLASGRKEQKQEDSATSDRDGRRRSERKPTRGGEAPAARKTVALPATWAEYVELAKKDPKRKAELDKLPHSEFDPAELRRRSREQDARASGRSR